MTLTDSQKWLFLAGVFLGGWLLYLLAPVLTPFLLGALFAYLGDPSVDRLESWGLSRTIAVITVFVAMTLLVVLVVLLGAPIFQQQLALFLDALPGYIEWAGTTLVPWLSDVTGLSRDQLDFSSLAALLRENWSQAGGVAVNLLSVAGHSGVRLLGWVANGVLIPVVTFYLLRDWDDLVAGVDHLLPRKLEPEIAHIAGEADSILSAFLRGQLLVMLCLGMIYSIGLWLAGVQFALLIGMLAGLVSFVPYLGFIVGVAVAGMAALFQSHDLLSLVPVLAVFGVGQAIEGMVLTPLLVGDRIGLHPVMVIFSVVAGAQLFGFVGMLVALPAAAVLAVIVRDLHRRYLESQIYAAPVAEADPREQSAERS